MTVEWTAPAIVRALIARAVLEPAGRSATIGEIELAPHQLDAVARLRRELGRAGGALLADAVGLGKTYVALALAAEAERPLVVAPAALRTMWSEAGRRVGMRMPFVSAQRMSRGLPAIEQPDLVIVDEAHHFRNPATRRYAALAALTRRSRVLLLSATPVHNTARDLDALLALFLGASAFALDDAGRAKHIVRRAGSHAWGAVMPRVEPTRWIELSHRADLLDAIAALPPPVPPSDGDDGGALLLFSLLRLWSSSEGALAVALRRRLARAVALISALEDGRYPTKAELTAWRFAGDTVQLAFPGLVAAASSHSTAALLAQARTHESAVRALLRRIERPGEPGRPTGSPGSPADSGLHAVRAGSADAERAERLRTLRASHPGEGIVVFSQFAATIETMWREMRSDARVCAMSGNGARVAGGTISRAAALERFAPSAMGAPPPADAERIELLLTTDLLSEGVNLQDASVIVHLDLPWTPARIEQRVGRLARPGAASGRIAAYAFAPPAKAEAVLDVQHRLRAKLQAAARTAGVSGTILPELLGAGAGDRSPTEHHEAVRRVLETWRRDDVMRHAAADSVIVAAVDAPRRTFVVLMSGDAGPLLLASAGGRPTDDPERVREAIELIALAEPAPVDESEVRRCLSLIDEWAAFDEGRSDVRLDAIAGARARRRVIQRIAVVLARAARHDRARIAPLAAIARQAALMPLGAGAESVLRELATARMADEAWLRTLGAFGAAHRRTHCTPHGADDAARRGGRRPVALMLSVER